MLRQLFLFTVSALYVQALHEFPIGGLFNNVDEQTAFIVTAEEASNSNPYYGFKLTPLTYNIASYNTFEAYRRTCSLLHEGIIGLFGPSSLFSSPYIQSICDRKEIPHIETHWDARLDRTNCLVNLHPHPSVVSNVFVDLIEAFNWYKIIILYENDESLTRIAPLLHLDHAKRSVTLRQLEVDIITGYRSMLTTVKLTGETNFIIECSIDILEEVLIQAQQVGMMTENYNYIITNLDMQTVDLSPFQYAGTNITGVRIIDPESPKVIKAAISIQNKQNANGHYFAEVDVIAAWKLRLKTALTIDAVNLFYEAVADLTANSSFMFSSTPMSCNSTDNWKSGYTIINYMKRKTLDGVTGNIKFGYEGFRMDFNLDILELSMGGLLKVGEWNSTTRDLKTNRVYKTASKVTENSLFNTTFIVIMCLTPPYAMLKETPALLKGNNRFEGFVVDVIDELARMLGFNYTLIIQKDGDNGNYDRNTQQWTGLIKKIIDGDVDLGIADLTITSERENAVDFTMPFMNLGISILYRKPEPVPPSLFMFASPFSSMVWIMLGVSYFLVSFAFFIMGRLSPSEWTNPYPCIEEPEYLINQFSIRNCLWFTIGSLMQQGSDLAPIGISTRTASGVWWFFTLIIVSSYTANLAAFLTVESLVTPFKNIEELANQEEIKYGAKKDGATAHFFRDSNITAYRQVWRYMASHPELMPPTNDDGVKKVETENYAFLMESTGIEYSTERRCTLGQVGNLLDDKGYGIAMKKESPYRNELSRAILKMKERGKLTEMKIKWWKEKRGGGNCATKSEGGEATPLDLQNVGGVFLVLFIGTILGFIGSFLEMCLHISRKAKRIHSTFKEELRKEFKFFMKFKQNVKEVEEDTGSEDSRLANCIK